MKKSGFLYMGFVGLLLGLVAWQPAADRPAELATTTSVQAVADTFKWNPESFADKKIIRYQLPGFDKLTLQQKKLVYYLTQAGYSGRDIFWDQNYRHNLKIRRALEKIVKNYQGKRNGPEWDAFMLYAKQVWFSNGIHHHYSNDKFIPGFSQTYFEDLLKAVGAQLSSEVLKAMFDPNVDAKRMDQTPGKDIVLSSAVNFYEPGITEKEATEFYARKKAADKEGKVSWGLNSKLVRNAKGEVVERVYSAKGLYAPAIKKIIYWLKKAVTVAENEPQANALKLLIKYYKTGDLKIWDEYNIAWAKATAGDIDYINSFIENYNDPLGMKATYETIVQINDFDASARMKVVSDNAQWFEDNSPVMPQHKKKKVSGITYKVVMVAGESGDSSPSTPIGVNLPNANWIRADYGSKSVSLGNIIEAYSKADGPGLLKEFAHDQEEVDRAIKHGDLASKMHTALHEVLGHASGQLEPNVDVDVLKQYGSPLEEARADLFALYYIMDRKLVDLGLLESDEVGKAGYDQYLRNGLMLQLRRIQPGKNIEQAHMRNRQMVSSWVFEKGKAQGAVDMISRDGKTYIDIKDYGKLRQLFGELLKEVQRIKSQGDFAAAEKLFETYGVKVNQAIHQEVLKRSEKLNIPPYGGFINPRLVPVMDAKGKISDIKVEYPGDFVGQMLEYGEKYSILPDEN